MSNYQWLNYRLWTSQPPALKWTVPHIKQCFQYDSVWIVSDLWPLCLFTLRTVLIGMGEPPADAFSTLIIIIIAVGLGTPLAIIIVGGVFVCVRKRMSHGSIYEPINWDLMVQAPPQYTHTYPISDEITDPWPDDKSDHTHITEDVPEHFHTQTLSGWKYHEAFWFKHVTYWVFYIFILQTDPIIEWLFDFVLFFLDMMLVCSGSHNNNNNPAWIISYFKTLISL